eukprot:CAMPEP_0174370822 /NCGR_PEP_ID=MMETSP0811_2-20130205/97412_1 /TAXON_ID=73025 ORGANISM="Eutreptiella gymnastica-like, Strain CCMP1594" /NCGR_SAMPLE_ID=MMETSP0811_2 /ASSEMBLY_ACC=CAM_ASM_000667 /LENGTH=51 /DNA_ID=CAMNT_0015516597 /DNA_START=801 /DNA_END=956 /DNA_ORIENTATION=+
MVPAYESVLRDALAVRSLQFRLPGRSVFQHASEFLPEQSGFSKGDPEPTSV